MKTISAEFIRKAGFSLGLLGFLLLFFWPDFLSQNIPAKRMLALTVLMAIWWMTEAIPISITALLPLPLYPLFKIMKTSQAAPNYGHHLIFLFLGGFLIAQAIQKWGLHRRFALLTLSRIGTQPGKIMLGFMLVTAFLSMWISNTATTLMVLPIALAVLHRLGIESDPEVGDSTGYAAILMLAIAFSASIGGTATLIGTPPNLVFTGVYQKYFPAEKTVTFVRWMGWAVPLMVILFVVLFYYLKMFIKRNVSFAEQYSRNYFREEIAKLGPMTVPETRVLIVFLLTAFLWMGRADLNLGSFVIPGWAHLIGEQKWIQDSSVAMFMAILLYLIPSGEKIKEFNDKLLDVKDLPQIPWDILLLFGGGFALAEGIQKTGLATIMATQLSAFQKMPEFFFVLTITLFITFLTGVTSNTAVATTILPIIAALSVASHYSSLSLMVPATFATSCAFILPVATPPNAIVFGSRLVPIQKMFRIGLGLNFITSLLITIYFTLLW